MKKCKILHIHDGNAVELHNGNRFFMEEYIRAEEEVDKLLEEGYVVKNIIPDVTPAIQREGSYSFYKGGFVVYLEKDF